MLDFLFSQSLAGAFFMMLENPVKWEGGADNEQILDYIFGNQKMVKANQVMLDQYEAKKEEFIGKTPKELFSHNEEYGKIIWRNLLDKGSVRSETEERTVRGKKITVEGYYKCIYNERGDFAGHFGIQRDITSHKLTKDFLLESESYLSTILQVITDIIIICDRDGVYLDVIANSNNKLYTKKENMLGKKMTDVLPEKQARKIMKALEKSFKEQVLQVVEYSLLIGEEERWFESRLAPLSNMQAVSFIVDITDRKRYQETLKLQLNFQQMLSGISSSFIYNDKDNGESIGKALCLMGEFFDIDRSYIFDATGNIFRGTHEWCKEGISSQKERVFNFVRGDWRWLARKMRTEDVVVIDVESMPMMASKERQEFQRQEIKTLLVVPFLDEEKIIGFVGADAVQDPKNWSQRDISMFKISADVVAAAIIREKREERVRYLSYNDQITGLYNRNYLEKIIREMSAKKYPSAGIIIADLNGLKLINDTYGYSMGDRALKIASSIVKESSPEGAAAGRWGGDEFVIVCPEISAEKLARICQKIREEEEYVDNIPLSLAAGCCLRNDFHKEMFEVLREAENNMHKQKLSDDRSNKSAVLNALLSTLAEKSNETREHTKRMQKLAGRLGRAMNLSSNDLDKLNLAIFMHDIGKINISEEILKKEDPLNEKEWEEIKGHPLSGYRIAKASDTFAHVAQDILSHHEKWDGSGYPYGLSGEDIPLLARIVTVVDSYEVMKNGRPYKKAMSNDEIVKELTRCAGSHFDPRIVEKFFEVLGSE